MKLIHGDCLEVLKTIPDQSIDFILTDLPYGTTTCVWDEIIPFDPMWIELKRIIKPNRVIALFGTEPFSSKLRLSNLKMLKYSWVWQKGKETAPGFIQAKNKPIHITEDIVIFSNGKTFHKGMTKNRMIYNPQGLLPKKIENLGRIKLKNLRVVKNSKKPNNYITEFTNYPSNILQFNSTLKNRLHPTQKPVELLEYLIKTYTNDGETVLDFTMGSGSTGVACKNTNREFIGIEKDEKYFNIAKERLNEINSW
jgi:site-specific DNA-methyltransferase (adenine-specific)